MITLLPVFNSIYCYLFSLLWYTVYCVSGCLRQKIQILDLDPYLDPDPQHWFEGNTYRSYKKEKTAIHFNQDKGNHDILSFTLFKMYIYFFMAAKEQVPIDLCFIGSRVCWSHRIKMTEWKSFSMEDDMCTICFSAESAPEFPRKREIDELCSLSPFPTPSGFTHRPPQ